MMNNIIIEDKKEILIRFIIGIFLIIIVVLSCIICSQRRTINELKKTTFPVEDIHIDSLNRVNTKIIIETEILDSIKDVEKNKVSNLNNDSTIKLFYKLIRN